MPSNALFRPWQMSRLWFADLLPGSSNLRPPKADRASFDALFGSSTALVGAEDRDGSGLLPVGSQADRPGLPDILERPDTVRSRDGEQHGEPGWRSADASAGVPSGAASDPAWAQAEAGDADSAITFYRLGQANVPGNWYVSDWAAGQSTITDWSTDNVRYAADGAVELILDRAAAARAEPYDGGEIQSNVTASTGTWNWTVQAPEMVDGAVFGMFVYRADWRTQPWLEFDFEFVGGDTTTVELAAHMGTPDGKRVSNIQKTVVDLGFDASLASHHYEIVVTGQEAIFRVDGLVVGSFDRSDIPGGVWNTGPLRGYADLWAADPRYDHWTGAWVDPGVPLVARVEGAALQAGVIDPVQFVRGTEGDDRREGTSLADRIDGLTGNDTLSGQGGADTVQGGFGDDDLSGGAGDDLLQGDAGGDRLRLDPGNDRLDGGSDSDWVVADAALAMTVDLSISGLQSTGSGKDVLLGIENAMGGAGADRLIGSTGGNVLDGGAGNDVLRGRAGADVLIGGTGQDDMGGGIDGDRDVFVFRSAGDSAAGISRDLVRDFVLGVDVIDLAGIDARPNLAGDQAFAFSGSQAAAWSVWAVTTSSGILLSADATGDRVADFQVLISSSGTLSSNSLIL